MMYSGCAATEPPPFTLISFIILYGRRKHKKFVEPAYKKGGAGGVGDGAPAAGKKGQPRRAVLNCLVLPAYTTLMVMLGSLPFREPASSGLLG